MTQKKFKTLPADLQARILAYDELAAKRRLPLILKSSRRKYWYWYAS